MLEAAWSGPSHKANKLVMPCAMDLGEYFTTPIAESKFGILDNRTWTCGISAHDS
jgi:hypothetical protein